MVCRTPFGIGPAYHIGMGRIDNTKLIYISGGVIIAIIVLALFLGSQTPSFLNSESGSQLQVENTAGHSYVRGAAPKASWRAIGNPTRKGQGPNAQPFDSGYTATNSYANNYVPAEEIRHPLVASTKFIKKKDKLKPKKSTKQADKKARRDGKGGLTPLSESPESRSALMTASLPGSTPAKKKKTAEEDEENLNSVEFWEDPIFVQEDASAVNKLVDSFKGKKVSSGVFYDVVGQMTEDTRPNVREMAVVALGSTPSAQSFSQLTFIKHNDAEAELRTEAGRYVASYTDVNKLSYVVSTLKSPNTSQLVAVEALRTLTASTQKYSNGGINPTGNDGDPTPPFNPSDVAALETRYTRALELIEQNNFANSSDPKIKSEATKTVASLNKFMTI